ncbi:hypothetical protein [Rahnella perminowiae]|nr:hypothetical protein [Rahnella perminowiae]
MRSSQVAGVNHTFTDDLLHAIRIWITAIFTHFWPEFASQMG